MREVVKGGGRLTSAIVFCSLLLSCPPISSQVAVPATTPTGTPPEAPKDTLGRDTPKGTVLGFIGAARKKNAAMAALYLNTPLRGANAENLARQLALVIDRRLPARLNQISDQPEGSLPDPLHPDQDLIGTISTSNGDLDILVERVDRGKAGKVWLFSQTTLDRIPAVFQELNPPLIERVLPAFLVRTRVATIPLFQYFAILAGLPLIYLLTSWLNRMLSASAGALLRRMHRNAQLENPQLLPPPGRLLLLALTIWILLSRIGLSLLARQFWSSAALIIAVVGCVWLLMLLSSWGERYLLAHSQNIAGLASVLRLLRRMLDGLIFFAALMFTLYHFGVNVTAALAGLGVGGIAIALAAQKTLENVIAGASLIADKAVRVGDFLKVGDFAGTVEGVGLRSTRLRTLDRSIICVPNAQIAGMSLETLSSRDKFWFHPTVSLQYQTTTAQLRSITTGITRFLKGHSQVDSTSVRSNFLRFGPYSLDLDIFAYVFALDWADFLRIQEELLFGIMQIIKEEGSQIAFPSQTMYLGAGWQDALGSIGPFPREDSKGARAKTGTHY